MLPDFVAAHMEDYIFVQATYSSWIGSEVSLGKDARRVPSSKIKVLTKDAKQMVNGPYYCPKCPKRNATRY